MKQSKSFISLTKGVQEKRNPNFDDDFFNAQPTYSRAWANFSFNSIFLSHVFSSIYRGIARVSQNPCVHQHVCQSWLLGEMDCELRLPLYSPILSFIFILQIKTMGKMILFLYFPRFFLRGSLSDYVQSTPAGDGRTIQHLVRQMAHGTSSTVGYSQDLLPTLKRNCPFPHKIKAVLTRKLFFPLQLFPSNPLIFLSNWFSNKYLTGLL